LKPDKEKSGDKIDGVVALVMAIGQAMTEQSTPKNTIPDNYIIRTL
jgi:phage terminase large subunit-like protein